jgi:hypothetical protein
MSKTMIEDLKILFCKHPKRTSTRGMGEDKRMG